MEILQAIVLGIIEGITEFLPISSTGHLIVAQDMMGYKDTSKVFTIVIQMGAIAAVIWFYRMHLFELVRGLFKRDKRIIDFWLVWIIATIPAGLVGLLLDAYLDTYAVTLTVAIALIIGGILLWLIEEYYHAPESKKEAQIERITKHQAVKIGLFQVLALIPGVSRSGATIIGGMLSGIDRLTAIAFSFYLSIPVILLAGIYKLSTEDIAAVSGGSGALVAGTVAAFLSAMFAIKWLLRYVSNHDLKIFAYYRIVVGSIIVLLVAIGKVGM